MVGAMPLDTTDVLLAAAHAPELEGLQGMLGKDLRGNLGGVSVAACTVGVGMPAAAAGTAAALNSHRPYALVLLGSYGYYPGASVSMPLLPRAVGRAALVDQSLMSGTAALPGPIPESVTFDPGVAECLGSGTGAGPITVATTLGITTDDGLAQTLGGQGRHDAENLEAYAVAAACIERGVKVGALLVGTNAVGAEGRAQWQEHSEQATQVCTNHVIDWLCAGAPGLG